MSTYEVKTVLSQEERDKLSQSWGRMIDCIVHELNAKISTFNMVEQEFGKIFSKINEVSNVESDIFNEKDVTKIRKLLELFKGMNSGFQVFCKSLHPFNKEVLRPIADFSAQDIQSCVQETLNTFSFDNEKFKALIQLSFEPNFIFRANSFFIRPMLHYLLRKNLMQLEYAQTKGEIYLWTEESKDNYLLRIRNTATEAQELDIATAFQFFFEKNEETIIPSLGCCRLALRQIGGDILCMADEDNRLRYTVVFPKN
jgi:hypothetical protein